MIKSFNLREEIDFRNFEKDTLSIAEIFSQGALEPEGVLPTDAAGEKATLQTKYTKFSD